MLRKNDVFEMKCDAFGQDAQGVCRHEGMAVFVPGLLPGETALVRIVKPEKRYAFGRVEKLLSASADRRAILVGVSVKLVLLPLAALSVGAALGFRGVELGAMAIAFAAPTSVSSFSMAQQMGADADLAASMVVFTGTLSCLTIFLWMFALLHLGMI